MKFIKNNGLGMAMLAVSGLLAFASCSDTWDDHYSGSSTLSYAGTTLQYIESQEDLKDFASIIKATGYDKDLSSSQVLTIFAPQDGTYNSDSLLQLVTDGKKQQVIDRFIKNHISRYNISMNNEEQTLMLLNEKNLHLGTLAENTVGEAKAVRTNISCKNGVLQVIDKSLPYSPNLYEYFNIENDSYNLTNDSVVSFFNFIKRYDDDQLDESQSVEKGFDENGNKVYVDSVMIRRNTILASYDAYLYREDSNYVAISPSLEAYQKRVAESLPYFKYNVSYNPDEAVRDSMQTLMANASILRDLVFNMNSNQHPEDSLFSTSYSRNNWEHDVFYKPYDEGGILSNYNSITECSNGKVYHMDDIPFDIYDSFFHKIVVEGESSWNIETDDSYTDATATSYSTVRISTADSIMGHAFMRISPATSNKQTKIAYAIPSTLSGTYDIYLRLLPEDPTSVTYTVDENGDSVKVAPLPCQFRVSLYERDAKGQYPSKASQSFRNPKDNSLNFQNRPEVGIDSVYIGRYTFKECYYGASNAGVLLQLGSYVTTANRNKFTKEMILDNISLIPVREDENVQASAKKSRK